jgi:two-component system sensor histidine kinase YesM
MIRIIIADNGIGIPKDELGRIIRTFHAPETGSQESSLGLRSVYERLKLMYGDSCGMEVSSDPQRGTTVIIRFLSSEGGDGGDV